MLSLTGQRQARTGFGSNRSIDRTGALVCAESLPEAWHSAVAAAAACEAQQSHRSDPGNRICRKADVHAWARDDVPRFVFLILFLCLFFMFAFSIRVLFHKQHQKL